MPGRLEYERAIRRSDLPPPSRHIALTVATWADMDTGIIPERFQPSLRTLAEATGLNRVTVQRHLDRLETDGWMVRDRPEAKKARMEHARTRYSLALPPGARCTENLGAQSTQPLDAESTQAGCTENLELGAESTTRVPKSHESQDSSAASGGQQRKPKQPKPNKHQVADDLTAAFWKRHGKGRAQSFVAVRSVIRTAVGNGVERDDLARALDQVAREGRSISGGTLDTALGNLRRTNGWQRPGGHRPYSDPDNQDEYDGDI